jgi:hypothetical protein
MSSPQIRTITELGIHVNYGSYEKTAPLPERIELTEEGTLPEGIELTEEETAAAIAYQSPATPAPVPQEVGPAQLRVALIMSGVAASEAALDALVTPIIDAIADPTEREIARVLWTRATSFKRTYPLIEAARVALGWTNDQVDDLFRIAATI